MRSAMLLATICTLAVAFHFQLQHIGRSGEAVASLPKSEPAGQIPIEVTPQTHRDLLRLFDEHGYDDSTLNQGVPLILVDALPGDLADVKSVSTRKAVFFLSLLPMVLIVNDEILAQREFLLELDRKLARHQALGAMEEKRFASLANEYGLKKFEFGRLDIGRLLDRVDQVPPSLVLAQAANESGWGTSRFALQANNLFGQWTFTPGTGLVPEGRPKGETYEVRLFDNLLDSVRSYMKNLNTHPAYRSFRQLRRELREQGAPLKGIHLAQGLKNYSIRRDEYVKEIVDLIRTNNLARFSAANLREL